MEKKAGCLVRLLNTEIEIPIGHSRYGGPVINLPIGDEHPEDLRFKYWTSLLILKKPYILQTISKDLYDKKTKGVKASP